MRSRAPIAFVAAALCAMALSAFAQAPRFTVSADDARAHGLLPIGFSVDLSGTTLSARAFPEPGTMARLSGPPGGPLLLEARTYPGNADDAALERQVRQTFGARPGFALGPAERVTVAGAPRIARAFALTDAGMRASYCAVLIPSPRARRPYGLWLALAITGPADCAQVLAHPALARALGTLRTE